jgi:hypothetical protein
MEIRKVFIKSLGPIGHADMDLGDLTVLVGPQATGKSICLQLIKLFLDAGTTMNQLLDQGYDWHKDKERFLSLFLGEGMEDIWGKQTKLVINGKPIQWRDIETRKLAYQKAFYIPAQRVVTIENSWPKPFTSFDLSYPFVVREFSEFLRFYLEAMISSGEDVIFPGRKILKSSIRSLIEKSIFRNAELIWKRDSKRREMALKLRQNRHVIEISVGSWSAGQREFVPLLLGMYYSMPAGWGPKRGRIKVVIVEEIEMGLHPEAITGSFLLLMDLLSRGYQVIVSTHSPVVLDYIWAIRQIQVHRGTQSQFIRLFGIDFRATDLYSMARECLKKKYKVFYFEPDKRVTVVKDISDLDPGSGDAAMSGWGGLTDTSDKAADIVSELSERSRRP